MSGKKKTQIRKITTINLIKNVILYTVAVILALVIIIPFLWVIDTALKEYSLTLRYPPEWILFKPKLWNPENFSDVIKKYSLVTFYINSLIVATIEVISTIAMSSLAGYAFAKLKFRGRDILFLIILGTMTVPFQVYMVPVYVFVVKLMWVNTYQGRVLPYLLSGFSVFMMRQFMRQIPDELIDAARIDGCSEFQIYRKIILPLIKPAIATVTVYAFMTSWNEFIWSSIVLRRTQMLTLPIAIMQIYAGYGSAYQFTPYWNYVMAAILLAVAPSIVVFVALQKWFVRGITLQGLKG